MDYYPYGKIHNMDDIDDYDDIILYIDDYYNIWIKKMHTVL